MEKNLWFSLFLFLLFSVTATAQTEKWVRRYNGSGNQGDIPVPVYVDGSGNSYVGAGVYDTTGGVKQRITVIKYDSSGNRLWLAMDTTKGYANAMTMNALGEIFLTGYSGGFAVLKLDSSGTFLWRKILGNNLGIDYGTALTSDSNYVYVTGSFASPFWHDFRTVKLDRVTGAVQNGWPKDFNGTGNQEDVPASIAIDGSGHVFVTGWSLNSSGDKDYLTIGYDTSGNMMPGWPQFFDGPDGYLNDMPRQLILSDDKVYITGSCDGAGPGYDTTSDICTVVYDYSGNMINGWPQVYNGTGNSLDGVGVTNATVTYKPMALDAAGNVYVGGWTRNLAGNFDMVTFKYDHAGVIQPGWPQFYDNLGKDDITRGLVLDAENDVCITGWTTPWNASNGDIITIEYDSSGTMMTGWPVFYNGPDSIDDQGQSIAAVGRDIWITGYSTGSSTFQDLITIKYSNGNLSLNGNDLPPRSRPLVFPNPSDGKFIVKLEQVNGETAEAEIYDMTGRKITSGSISFVNRYFEFDLSSCSAGMYWVKIIANGQVYTGKVAIH